MSDFFETEAWIEANATLLGIDVVYEWREAVRMHLRITRDLAHHVLAFPLPDEADPAPVFRA